MSQQTLLEFIKQKLIVDDNTTKYFKEVKWNPFYSKSNNEAVYKASKILLAKNYEIDAFLKVLITDKENDTRYQIIEMIKNKKMVPQSIQQPLLHAYLPIERDNRRKYVMVLITADLGINISSQIIKDNPPPILSLSEIKFMFIDFILGIEWLHNTLKVTHNDLVPTNVVKSVKTSRWTIIDFDRAQQDTQNDILISPSIGTKWRTMGFLHPMIKEENNGKINLKESQTAFIERFGIDIPITRHIDRFNICKLILTYNNLLVDNKEYHYLLKTNVIANMVYYKANEADQNKLSNKMFKVVFKSVVELLIRVAKYVDKVYYLSICKTDKIQRVRELVKQDYDKIVKLTNDLVQESDKISATDKTTAKGFSFGTNNDILNKNI